VAGGNPPSVSTKIGLLKPNAAMRQRSGNLGVRVGPRVSRERNDSIAQFVRCAMGSVRHTPGFRGVDLEGLFGRCAFLSPVEPSIWFRFYDEIPSFVRISCSSGGGPLASSSAAIHGLEREM
jgi:hypothetical protein